QDGWERPHAARVFVVVFGVGVDVAFAIELEAGGLREIDHELLGDVAALFDRLVVRAGIGAVLDDAERSTVLEDLEHRGEDLLLEAALDPVVDVAEREDDVLRLVGAEHELRGWGDAHGLYFSEEA